MADKGSQKTKVRSEEETFRWAIPNQINVDPDQVILQLNFHHGSIEMRTYDDNGIVTTKPVSARAIAHVLAEELTYTTGLLPENCLWWNNTKRGATWALYEPPKTRIITLQENLEDVPRRFKLPIPGLVLLCTPGHAPAVYAVKRKPSHSTDVIYSAPFTNIYSKGNSCPGNHKYPQDVRKIPENFFISFFTTAGDVKNRSLRFPENILHLWADLDGKKTYPLGDLVRWGTLENLIQEK